jgi:hypothetical protein
MSKAPRFRVHRTLAARGNGADGAGGVPFTQFAIDLTSGSAPPFLFVTPNTTHDMHVGAYQQGDGWLAQQFAVILASSWCRQGGSHRQL